ncbi:sensor domain-containing phosphodiesterase [Aliikangiella sp. IMCC44632]
MSTEQENNPEVLRQQLAQAQSEIASLKREARRFAANKKLQSALFRIVDIANSAVKLSDFYRILHQIVDELTSAKNFFIAIYHPESDALTFPYYVDHEDDQQSLDGPLHNSKKQISLQAIKGGPTEKIIRTGLMVHVNKEDFTQYTLTGKAPENWLGVPLKQNNKILGAIVVQSYESGFKYSPRDENLLNYVSQHIATALRRKRDSEALKLAHQQLTNTNQLLESRVAERTQELKQINQKLTTEVNERRNSEKIQKALFKITDLVSTSKGLGELFEGVHATISELMYAENAFIAILSEDKQYLEFPYFVDIHDARPGTLDVSKSNPLAGDSLTAKVLISGQPLFLSKNNEQELSMLGPSAVSWIGVPLCDQSDTFGVLVVQSYDIDHLHTQQNLNVLLIIAKQVATAILRKYDAEALTQAHENLERRVKERTSILEMTIEKRKVIEKQLEHESLHDALTQLPNRRYLTEQLNVILGQPQTSQENDIALLFLDLDRFKIINDSLGHHVGDLFLIEVAKRLAECMREDDVVVRLGGDEFCVLMFDVFKEHIAVQLAQRVLNQLQQPVIVEQHSLMTSASIGIRMGKVGVDSADQLVGDADSAMYQAKQNGKNRFCLFDANIKKLVSQRLQLEQDLRLAIGGEQLSLHYQPIIDLFNNNVVGVEALIRWKHPTLGYIGPVDFIPIAEETGLIQELGESIVSMACKGLQQFSQHPETQHLYVNINISAMQILSRTLDTFIRQKITEFQVDPAKLNAEITESILVEDFKAATQFVQELKSIGMKVILDDFGTGYSSLSYLHQFPFDLIKLDRSFIQSSHENQSKVTLIESIGFLATNLGMEIVVEGIETEQQMSLSQNLNCRFGQGYLFSKPIPSNKLIDFMQSYSGVNSIA